MQEAFRKAAQQNPNSNFSRQVESTGYTIREERRQQQREAQRLGEITRLIERFKIYGGSWEEYETFTKRTDDGDEYLGRVREKWGQENLTSHLTQANDQERQKLLSGFAYGADLDLDRLHRTYINSVFDVLTSNVPINLSTLLGGKSFTLQAQLMMKAIGDILGYNESKRKAFLDFMHENLDQQGQITLRQSLPAISKWFMSSPIK